MHRIISISIFLKDFIFSHNVLCWFVCFANFFLPFYHCNLHEKKKKKKRVKRKIWKCCPKLMQIRQYKKIKEINSVSTLVHLSCTDFTIWISFLVSGMPGYFVISICVYICTDEKKKWKKGIYKQREISQFSRENQHERNALLMLSAIPIATDFAQKYV